jgi:hypothetical protein
MYAWLKQQTIKKIFKVTTKMTTNMIAIIWEMVSFIFKVTMLLKLIFMFIEQQIFWSK